MKKIIIIPILLFCLFANAQTLPPVDTALYLTKSNIVRTDTLATNLLTLNQSNNTAQPMSGTTLKGLLSKWFVSKNRSYL